MNHRKPYTALYFLDQIMNKEYDWGKTKKIDTIRLGILDQRQITNL